MQYIDDKLSSGLHNSCWLESLEEPIQYTPLTENSETEVVIVGGGIAGLSIAYRLCALNIKVILVEDGFIGSGETGRTSAHLAAALDDRYYSLEKIFDKELARLAAESHAAGIDFIEAAVNKEGIDCDFRRVNGYLFRHPSDEMDSLEKELQACLRAGISVKMLEQVPGMTIGNQPCIEFSNQAQFHPLKYLKGLCTAILKKGGKIFTGTHAAEIDATGIVTGAGYKITAKHVVVATNSPVNNKFVMHLKQYAYRTYCIAAKIKKETLPVALWWDTGDFNANPESPPYHYIRTQSFSDYFDLLICGGEDHPTGLIPDDIPEEDRYQKLEAWCRSHFPIEEILYKWSGQVLEPMDGMAYIGKNPLDKNNVYIVTGDSGNGLTHGSIAGMLIPDLITGKKNEWEKLYNPSRFKIFKAGKVFFKEVIGGFIVYLKNTPKHTEEVKLSEMKAGEGVIMELEGKKYGVYADEYEALHVVAAECTHLQCIVKWNNDEKSWDCPCHGSRFTIEGKVLNGPAIKDLEYQRH